MPWVNKEMCTGCELCIEVCPVEAIEVSDGEGFINDDLCVRCGKCHDICPEEAVRHDGERIPEEIAANLDRTRGFLKHCATPEERDALLERMKRFFNKERKVASQTLAELNSLEGYPAEWLLRKAAALRRQMNGKAK